MEVDWNEDHKWILLFDNLLLSHDKKINHGIFLLLPCLQEIFLI